MNTEKHITACDDWLEIQLETTADYDSDTLEEALFAAGALSVTLTGKSDEIMLIEPKPGELPLWEKGMIVTGLFEKGFDENAALPILKACLGTESIPLVTAAKLADRQWELEWTKYFHPLQFGDSLWICPSNQTVAQDKITATTQILTLDPGLAFGTGTHPTTAMALTAIATRDIDGLHVIDYGCGSGVLGMAAAKMGAEHVIMTDIDPQALSTAKQNAALNQLTDGIDYYLPESMPAVKTDFLIANILLEPLLALRPTFVAHCHTGSAILLTGLLNEQADTVINAYQKEFDHFNVTSQGDWAMVTARFR